MKLITHMEPSQIRLGYLSCLSVVAGRHLDTRNGLVDRLGRFLFRVIDASDPRWGEFMDLVDQDEIQRMKIPLDAKTSELYELFRVKEPAIPSYQLQALWLSQRHLPSHIGLLTEKNSEYILNMGRSFEILTTGYALSEKGVFLQNLVASTFPQVFEGAPRSNPFAIHSRPALQLFFLYTLLSVDVLTPFLIDEFAKTPKGDLPHAPRLLPIAGKRMVAAIEEKTDISTAESLRQSRVYSSRLEAKGVARNQAQPRYHHLFELGILDRVESEDHGRRIVPYLPTRICASIAKSLSVLRESPEDYQNTIDKSFFGWAANSYQPKAKPCNNDLRRLYYFARGFPFLEREIGFTPGRTVALAGCLLAIEEGWIIEVAEMFDLLRRMAAGPWRKYLEYSGGSRLDQEFLIKVKPELIPALEQQLENGC